MDADETKVYDAELLHLMVNRIYDMPDIDVVASCPPRINVLVPAFDFNSISAGFFGVFQIARYISQCGFRVRLVLFDNFYYDEALFRSKFLDYPGLENIFSEIELEYLGERKAPLQVSPYDNCVATVWYSAHFARKIMSKIGGRPFVYLIQDYETNFFAGSSLYAFADETYSFNYNALFSTKPLQDFFLTRGIGNFGATPPRYIYFNNACSSSLPDRKVFFRRRSKKRPYRLAFYSRPVVHRNMFELGALALCTAYRRGIFEDKPWEFIGIGLGKALIELGPGVAMQQMARMNLREYQEVISTFDVGLSLMASSHPSLLPFDLAGSGSVVVTNSFGTKDQSYFSRISPNILVGKPELDSIVETIGKAVQHADRLDERYQAAKTMMYPCDWSETFSADHRDFLRSAFSESLEGDAGSGSASLAPQYEPAA